MRSLLRLLLLCAATSSADAHGALLSPMTRRGNTGYENDPVRFDSEAWVCRHATPNANVPLHAVTAGTNMPIQWDFSAAHVGDCAVFISYDVALPLAQQQYFKIANLPKCRDQNRMDVDIAMPAWLPAGQAILRWDWYALHQGPNSPEYYSQCVDLTITSTSSTTVESIVKYPIIGIYPPAGAGAYRNAFGNGKNIGEPGFIMTGPACADATSTDNNCPLSANNGNGGDITGGGGGGTASPPPPQDGGGGGGGGGGTEPGPPACVAVVYTVGQGETLSDIAAKHSEHAIDWQQICDENGLVDCDAIFVGQPLTIPCDDNLQTAAPSGQGTGGGGGGGGGAGMAVGVSFALLASGAMIAFAIYKRRGEEAVPPPPPGRPMYAAKDEISTTSVALGETNA